MMENSTSSSRVSGAFTRRSIHDGEQSLIACHCSRCGALMFYTAIESALVEAKHVMWCPKNPLARRPRGPS